MFLNVFLKKVNVVLIFLSILFFSVTEAVAQSETEFLDDQGTTYAPQLYVHNIKISENISQQKKITGTFSVYNVGQQTAGDISHQVSIISLEDIDGKKYPVEILSSGDRTSPYLVPSGKKDFTFEIDIPASLPTDTSFGIYIELFTDDEPGAYDFVALPFDISTQTKTIEYISVGGEMRIGNEVFFMLEGPTVLSGEVLELHTTIASTTAYQNVFQKVLVYQGPVVAGVPVYESDLQRIELSATQPTKTVILPPVKLDPDVYTIQVYYFNDAKESVASFLEGRYVLDGLSSNIHAVSYNSLDQNTIETFDVYVSFAEKPLSARIGPDGAFIDPRAEQVFVREGEEVFEGSSFAKNAGLSMAVSLIDNATGRLIDEKRMLVSAVNPTTFRFKPIEKSTDITVSVELLENNMRIDKHNASLTIYPRTPWIEQHMLTVMIASGVGILVLTIVIFLILQKRKTTKNEIVTSNNIPSI